MEESSPLDSSHEAERQPLRVISSCGSKLRLSADVTLALSTYALLVSDGTPKKHKPTRICGSCVRAATDPEPTVIPYFYILWAEILKDRGCLRVDYVEEKKNGLEVRQAQFDMGPACRSLSARTGDDADGIRAWVERLMEWAYGKAQRGKRAWVLVNPHAGRGEAEKTWERQVRPLLEAARMPLEVLRTTHSGQAVDLARGMDLDAHDVVIACSGDGLPHEVFNGLAQRADARHGLATMPVCHIPCGSGNAMSCNLYGSHRPTQAALAIVKGIPTPLDLASITQKGRRMVSFLSQAFGMIADLDLATEHLRWMGAGRFTYGFLSRVLRRTVYPCDVAVKVEMEDKQEIRRHYRRHISVDATLTEALSHKARETDTGTDADMGQATGSPTSKPIAVPEGEGHGLPPLRFGVVTDKLPDGWELLPYEKLQFLYCGLMPYMAPDANFFPAALANDGLMDLITVDGDVPAWKAIQMQMAVGSGRFFDSPSVRYRKVSAYRIVPRSRDADGNISIDGERIPFEPFQAEVHPRLGLTLSRHGVFEAPGPPEWTEIHDDGPPSPAICLTKRVVEREEGAVEVT